ncbi:MAG: homocysteine S-methyltransferase family protein [Lachnospiraceae bacterium]|nr:homocysteine S-methyltransferase family protein [Lachnospiraceae bacterium]
MCFEKCFEKKKYILMEGALGERLKREYAITFDDNVAMAGLIYDENGRDALEKLWKEYIEVAKKFGLAFMATTPTRRANKERVKESKYSKNIIADNMEFLKKIKAEAGIEMYAGGLMGCKGDAYKATEVLSAEESQKFHFWQANEFKKAGADFLYAGIMPSLPEAIGMAKAMEKTELPYIISFMIRKDGCLIDGTTISDAIETIDGNVERKPMCFMTNCVHPRVLETALKFDFNKTKAVRDRFCGIQANTSQLSPEELDCCDDLMCSDPKKLAEDIWELKKIINLKIIGGCCGTDNSHMEEIAKIGK